MVVEGIWVEQMKAGVVFALGHAGPEFSGGPRKVTAPHHPSGRGGGLIFFQHALCPVWGTAFPGPHLRFPRQFPLLGHRKKKRGTANTGGAS